MRLTKKYVKQKKGTVKMKRFSGFLLVVILLVCGIGPGFATETRGFATPDACVQAVADALIQADTDALLDCYAIGEAARAYDFKVALERLQAVQIGNTLLPPASALNIRYNEARLTYDLVNRMFGAAFLLANEDADALWGRTTMLKQSSVEELTAMANCSDVLTKLSVQGQIEPTTLHEKYEMALEKQLPFYQALYGGDEWRETVVVLDLSGRTIYMPLALVRYGDTWLAVPVSPVIASLLGIPHYTLLFAADML